MGWRPSPALAAAAARERDRRRAAYPPRIRDRRLDAEVATIDWQAWVCIADWLADGSIRWIGTQLGTADDGLQLIEWSHLEAATARALAKAEDELTRRGGDARREHQDKRDTLWCIHHRIAAEAELQASFAALADAKHRPEAFEGRKAA